MSWTEIGMFWVTVVVGVVTTAATLITYFLYRSETDPEVIIYPEVDEKRPSILNLVIENIGRRSAESVRFSPDRDIPVHAFGMAAPSGLAESGISAIATGIPMLEPRGRRVFTWGQYGGLAHAIGEVPIRVKISYEGGRGISFLPRRRHVAICFLDIRSFQFVNAADHNYDKKQAESLKRIADALEIVSRKLQSVQSGDEL